MAEEINIDNFGTKYAISGASAFIFNDEGKLFLTRSPKWENLWVVPGGKVEFGESLEETLRREIKEETNLSITDIKYFIIEELNRTKEQPNSHIVVTQYIARTADKDVKLNNEHIEFDWRTPEDWLKEKDLHPTISAAVEYYLNEYANQRDCESKYKRALADYQNLLKQTAKEKMEFAVYANEQMLREILPIFGHLKMALEHASGTPNNAKEITEGIGHVVKQFKDTLEKLGIQEIKTKGEKFDHNTMESVSNEETDDKKLDGLVAKELKGGYKLNGKLLEAAKVVVYKLKS